MIASRRRNKDYRQLTSKVGPTTRDVSTLQQEASIPGRKDDTPSPSSVSQRDSVGGLARLKRIAATNGVEEIILTQMGALPHQEFFDVVGPPRQ